MNYHTRYDRVTHGRIFTGSALDAWPCASAKEGWASIDGDLRLLGYVEAEIAQPEQQLAEALYAEPRVKLLMTLPGVSLTVVQTLWAVLGAVERFRDTDHAASYLGLVPSTRQSGKQCYHGSITKQGHRHARALLVQAAHYVAD